MPEVSVIIPLYNKAKYINGAVNSVLGQTFTDFELIIIDDGSTDGGSSVISVRDSRIEVIRQANAGPGRARNKGLSLAKGSYVAFLDADDSWHSDFLATGVSRLKENPHCDLFLSGATWQPEAQVRLPVLRHETDPASGAWRVPIDLGGSDAHDVMNFFALGTLLLKRHVPDLYGGFFHRTRCTSGEDSYLWVQVMLNHTIFRELRSCVEINTEGSALGIGRKGAKPIPPALIYSTPLFENCPEIYEKLLKSLLDFTAFMAIRRELYKINLITAWRLYLKFPGLHKYRSPDFPEFPKAMWQVPFDKLRRKLIKK